MISINDPGNFWITSDTHFGHDNIRSLCNRPFDSVEEMDSHMISQWNSVVKPKDTIIHLGDFSYKNSKSLDYYRNQLNGKIIIIRGNHDSFQDGQVKHLFSEIYDYLEIRVKDEDADQGWQKIVCFHYPIFSWNGKFRKSIHLFGHTHNGELEFNNQYAINCCVENWNYTPISYEQIKKKLINV